MPHTLIYTRTAVSDIKKLDIVVRKRLGKKLQTFAREPMTYGKKLIDASIGSYRWRIGDYRIIFDMDGKNIVILRIKHRRESYK
ncbi:MAG: type II toxin-antitoxin system RelE/ParE family toxin [Candidatus Levybacteria bacterium]|nr:type II toxin-antitoxin system RelE/ParE family toxin [Candidatus Levybacteria bacterium]